MRYRISKYKHLHSNRFRYLSSSIPLVCASGLLVVMGLMISPNCISEIGINGEAYAEVSNWGDGDSGNTAPTTPTVELSVANTNLVKPSTTSNINYISTGLTVTALNTDSYGIYVQSTNGSSNLTNNGTTISGVGNNVSTTNFGTNTWGYSVADGTVGEADLSTLTYSTIPTSASSAAKSGTTAEAKPFTLAFAAKFADSATPGHYNGNVLVSVAANPGEVTSGFGGIEYMQELTDVECVRASIGSTVQLVDARDGNMYWVAKLKDGNCWMVQNLDYDDPNSTEVVASNPSWGNSANSKYYYNPGEKIVVNDKLVDFTVQDDPHYLVGNYYTFSSATRGSGDNKSGVDATESICPRYWRLPKSGNSTGEYLDLISGLGIDDITVAPYYFTMAGGVSSGLTEVGLRGNMWSSTTSNCSGNPSCAYSIYFGTDGLKLDTYAPSRYYGYSVRCLVDML